MPIGGRNIMHPKPNEYVYTKGEEEEENRSVTDLHLFFLFHLEIRRKVES